MPRRQIISLFICNLVPYVVGNGLIPLLPIYVRQLGASSAVAGYYLAFSYLAIALGTISAGWISDKFQRRKGPVILAGLLSIPATWQIGHAENIWSLSVWTASLWFCGGFGLGLIGILAGLSANVHERGKIFGILSTTSGLGAFVGGLTTGFIVDKWGFPTMFAWMVIFLFLWPISGLFLIESKISTEREEVHLPKKKPGFGRNYVLLFCASLIASIAGFIIVLGRSLLMEDMNFNALEISLTGAVSGIVSMPLPLLMGWLSDRMDRKVFLYIGYMVGIFGLAILAIASELWHFIIVLCLQAIFLGVNLAVGNALVTDLVPPEVLGRGLARFSATIWVGGVLGFGIGGFALQYLGPVPTFILGIFLSLLGMMLLIPVRSNLRSKITISLV